MKRLTTDISIGNYNYKGVVNLEIVSSSETLTDTATITFPRKTAWKEKNITELISRNDNIGIKIGYDSINDELFRGIVRAVKADIPFTVQTDDTLFKLKKNSIKKSYKSVTLNQLLTDISPIAFEAKEIQLGKFRINNATPAEVLKHLKTKYGIYSFVRGDILYSGLQYWGNGRSHEFSFTKDIISHSLEYRKADDISFQVKAISIMPDNSRIEVKKGDTDGENRTFHYYNIDKKELERRAEQELEKLKFDGYRGSFTTFGQPAVLHGDTVKLIDKNYPEREGIYIVKAVRRNFGQNGYRQTIEIDRAWK